MTPPQTLAGGVRAGDFVMDWKTVDLALANYETDFEIKICREIYDTYDNVAPIWGLQNAAVDLEQMLQLLDGERRFLSELD